MTTGRHSSGALGDLRVLELADERGQWCGKLMADAGADVIKVEPPGGVAERRVGPFYQDIPHPERSLYFWHYNTSKRGITLDLENATGRDILRRLVANTDVLLETYAPGYLSSLGLGYDELSRINPRLIMCSLTPFGQTGPWSGFRSSDLLHLAAGGQMASCGYEEKDVPDAPPIAPGGGNGWQIGSHYAYIAIMAAVNSRDVTGEGQYIDSSIHGACALTTEAAVPTYIYQKQVVQRRTGRHANVQPTPETQLRTKDGKYIQTTGSFTRFNVQQLNVVAEWMDGYGLAQDLRDPKYQDPQEVEANQMHIMVVAKDFVANVDQEEAYYSAQKRGFGWGPVRAPEEVVADAHFHDREFFVQVEHPELGQSFTYPGAAAIYSRTPMRVTRAPLIGEHNAEVYGEIGISPQELAVLRETGSI